MKRHFEKKQISIVEKLYKYGKSLKNYFKNYFPNLDNTTNNPMHQLAVLIVMMTN